MAKFIILRLHPDKSVPGAVFTGYLSNLEIRAFDASFKDPTGQQPGAFLGSTANAPSKIVQHTVPHPDPIKAAQGEKLIKSVASAMIKLEPQQSEYAGPDIVLHVLNRANLVRKLEADYNVAFEDRDPAAFDPTLVSPASVAAYVELPAPGLALGGNDAVVDLPKDGTPPNFVDLKAAVEKVLQQDPGSTQKLGALTANECRHIAHEIAWNRHVDPIPFAAKDVFEAMYTVPPPGEPLAPSLDPYAQQQFQGTLAQYRAVHDAKAEVLAKYVFALSAAIACEKKSAEAPLAGLSFPVRPGASPTEKVQAAEVILKT